eukprot:Trichotokara_eunicae@DN1801_c0_g1_i1.p1
MFCDQLSGICSDETGIENLKRKRQGLQPIEADESKNTSGAVLRELFGERFSIRWFLPTPVPYRNLTDALGGCDDTNENEELVQRKSEVNNINMANRSGGSGDYLTSNSTPKNESTEVVVPTGLPTVGHVETGVTLRNAMEAQNHPLGGGEIQSLGG